MPGDPRSAPSLPFERQEAGKSCCGEGEGKRHPSPFTQGHFSGYPSPRRAPRSHQDPPSGHPTGAPHHLMLNQLDISNPNHMQAT